MKSDQYEITEGVEYFHIAGMDANEIRVPKSLESQRELLNLLAQNLGIAVIPPEHIGAAVSTCDTAAGMLRNANLNGEGIVMSQIETLAQILRKGATL